MTHSDAGGVQEIWADIASGLAARGYECELVALYPHPDTQENGQWQHISPLRPRSLPSATKLLYRLIRYLRSKEPKIVFTAMPAANVLAPFAVSIAGLNCPIVISHHTPVDTYGAVLDLANSICGLLPTVRAVITVSNGVAKSLGSQVAFYRKKCVTIHNALPPQVESLLETLAGARGENEKGHRRIVATGRLAAQKNYPVLIHAAVTLQDAEIEVIGSGPDEHMLKEMVIRLGVMNRVRFIGRRSRSATLERLASGYIFVQPSLYEGHSLGLMEAAKLGLPLVVSGVPVQIEGITASDGCRCGIAVNPHDPIALAAELRRLLTDPGYHQFWSERARHLAASSTFEAQLDAYEVLVRKHAGVLSPTAGERM